MPLGNGISFLSSTHPRGHRVGGLQEILGIMSDLSITLEALERARSQLSVSTYFDEDLHRREQELIFQHGPRYLAHELSVPEEIGRAHV